MLITILVTTLLSFAHAARHVDTVKGCEATLSPLEILLAEGRAKLALCQSDEALARQIRAAANEEMNLVSITPTVKLAFEVARDLLPPKAPKEWRTQIDIAAAPVMFDFAHDPHALFSKIEVWVGTHKLYLGNQLVETLHGMLMRGTYDPVDLRAVGLGPKAEVWGGRSETRDRATLALESRAQKLVDRLKASSGWSKERGLLYAAALSKESGGHCSTAAGGDEIGGFSIAALSRDNAFREDGQLSVGLEQLFNYICHSNGARKFDIPNAVGSGKKR